MTMGFFFQMRSSAVVVVAMTVLLLLLASSEASSPSMAGGGDGGGGVHSARRVDVYGCSEPEELVSVTQNNDQPLHSGMPAYTVEISNSCLDCAVCDVHLTCGDFANTELVDPATFRRLSFDDCLVKDGGSLGPGEMVIFQYANSVSYPMTIASAACNCD